MNERTITPLNDGDNPPAFPRTGRTSFNGDQGGMTLRDYFAAATFRAVMFRSTGDRYTESEAANVAYRYADAMLRARKENGQ